MTTPDGFEQIATLSSIEASEAQAMWMELKNRHGDAWLKRKFPLTLLPRELLDALRVFTRSKK